MRALRSLHAHPRIYTSLYTRTLGRPQGLGEALGSHPQAKPGGRREAGRALASSPKVPPRKPPPAASVLCCRCSFSDGGGKSDQGPARRGRGDKGQPAGHRFKQRPRSRSRGTGGGATSAERSARPPRLPASPGRTQVGPEGPGAGAPRAGELCLFSGYSWPPSTRLFVAAKGTSGRAGALGVGWGGGPFAGPHEFYGIGARRAKLQAESKCVNYRFVL